MHKFDKGTDFSFTRNVCEKQNLSSIQARNANINSCNHLKLFTEDATLILVDNTCNE